MTEINLNPGPKALKTTFNFPVDTDFVLTILVINYKDENGNWSQVERLIGDPQKAQEKFDDAIA